MVKIDKSDNCQLVNKNKVKFYNNLTIKVYDMTTVAYVLNPEFVLKKTHYSVEK